MTVSAALVVLSSALSAPTAAQMPWESPQMLSPGSPEGVGLFVADWGLGPGAGVGMLVTWRGAAAPGGIGLRGGAARGFDDELMAVAGLDYSLPVLGRSPSFPLDVIWIVGAGGSWGDYLQVGVPVGFAAGRSVERGTFWFNPYLSGRVAFEAFFGEERPPDTFGVGLAVDVGADVAFDRGRDFLLRVAASLGDRHALIAGLHVRM